MGTRCDNPEWERLNRDVLAAFGRWLKGQPWDVTFRSWFDDGRSGSPVALVSRTGEGRNDDVVMKFFLKGAKEVRQWKAAIDGTPPLFGTDHLTRLAEDSPLGDRDESPWIATVVLVGGDLSKFRPLVEAQSLLDASFAGTCTTVVGSVIEEWNPRPRRPDQVRDVAVSKYLARIFDPKRLEPGKPLRNWADAADIPMDAPLLRRPMSPDALPNPIALCTATTLLDDLSVRAQFGRAHGDLNVRNIYLETEPLRPKGYKLIDLGGYDADAPLARDPMHLLLSIGTEWLRHGIEAGSKMSSILVDVIVNPQVDQPGFDSYQRVSLAVHEAGRIWATRQSLGHHWRDQSLLALVGSALHFAGRDLQVGYDEGAVRGWFFDIAAFAARAYLMWTRAWQDYKDKHAPEFVPQRKKATEVSLPQQPPAAGGGPVRSRRRRDPDSNVVSFPGPRLRSISSAPPSDLQEVPGQGSWSNLIRNLDPAQFKPTDWTGLAASTEPLRQQLSLKRPTLPGDSERVNKLLVDLDRTLTSVLKPTATEYEIAAACRHATELCGWLRDLLNSR